MLTSLRTDTAAPQHLSQATGSTQTRVNPRPSGDTISRHSEASSSSGGWLWNVISWLWSPGAQPQECNGELETIDSTPEIKTGHQKNLSTINRFAQVNALYECKAVELYAAANRSLQAFIRLNPEHVSDFNEYLEDAIDEGCNMPRDTALVQLLNQHDIDLDDLIKAVLYHSLEKIDFDVVVNQPTYAIKGNARHNERARLNRNSQAQQFEECFRQELFRMTSLEEIRYEYLPKTRYNIVSKIYEAQTELLNNKAREAILEFLRHSPTDQRMFEEKLAAHQSNQDAAIDALLEYHGIEMKDLIFALLEDNLDYFNLSELDSATVSANQISTLKTRFVKELQDAGSLHKVASEYIPYNKPLLPPSQGSDNCCWLSIDFFIQIFFGFFNWFFTLFCGAEEREKRYWLREDVNNSSIPS